MLWEGKDNWYVCLKCVKYDKNWVIMLEIKFKFVFVWFVWERFFFVLLYV